MPSKPVVERAYELARKGGNLREIKHQLWLEGYINGSLQLKAPILRKELQAISYKARRGARED